MVNPDEVIVYFKEVKKTIAEIKDPNERHSFIIKALSKYTLSEWCEVGDILLSAQII